MDLLGELFEEPLVPEPVPDELELFTKPLLQPFVNSACEIVPSLSASTLLKSVTYGWACDIERPAPFEGFAWFHNVSRKKNEAQALIVLGILTGHRPTARRESRGDCVPDLWGRRVISQKWILRRFAPSFCADR